MVGILIVAHGAFGEALIHCASHVLGKRPLRVRQVGITVHDDPDSILLVLTDMIGATPSNIAARLTVSGKVEVVGGVNLPMLVRVLTYRTQPLGAVVGKAVSGGREGVMHVGAGETHAATGS